MVLTKFVKRATGCSSVKFKELRICAHNCFGFGVTVLRASGVEVIRFRFGGNRTPNSLIEAVAMPACLTSDVMMTSIKTGMKGQVPTFRGVRSSNVCMCEFLSGYPCWGIVDDR